MKLAIVGSRTFTNFKRLEEFAIENIKISQITTVISGGAVGADKLAEEFAKKYDIPIQIFYPNWKKYGKIAGFIRNEKIIKNCDEVIALWDGMSRGTEHSIGLARKYGKLLYILHTPI